MSEELDPVTIINTNAQKNWRNDKLGIRKELIKLTFTEIDKPSELSQCFVKIIDIKNLDQRKSNYLNNSTDLGDDEQQLIGIGEAQTPIDYLIEIFLQQMICGEQSKCYIKTKTGTEISFCMTLIKIEISIYLFELSVKDLYDWAKKVKELGSAIYKSYPQLAHKYFSRAAKALISIKPFDGITMKRDGITMNDVQSLWDLVAMNLAACLIKEKRYEDVLFVLKETTEPVAGETSKTISTINEDDDDGDEDDVVVVNDAGVDIKKPESPLASSSPVSVKMVPDKAIFRRATAHFHLKEYDEAKAQLERLNFKDNKEMLSLYNNIKEQSDIHKDKYKTMVQKMFG